MGIVRFLVVAMLVLGMVTMGLYLFTGNVRYKQQALRIFKYTIVVLCVFFTVLVFQRV